jgi:lipopolysaccharide export system protein LptA
MLVPAAFLALGAFVCAQSASAATLSQCSGDIELEGDNLDGDLRKNFTELKNVVITGCDARIEAKLARFSKLDFEDSRWTFEGDVRIRMEAQQGSLSSDQAVVNFRDNQIQRVVITGKPAEFEQRRTDSGAMARGRAGQIVYELGAGTINLSDDAWLSDGNTEIQSPTLVYDVRKQQVQASSVRGGRGSERVRLTINPASKNGKKNGKAPSSSDAPPSGQETPREGNPAGGPDKPKAP